ncbi:hypothetical protein RJ640_015925 [Escallonia rubra]|uniref:BRCT domain-containing protein n=1 Tax=Escallonia rubra TaxID=112253 RepID=A0AA88RE97_9ASTE|nr:hypothetical protein RJ640_015925 [Escallonia rubra]
MEESSHLERMGRELKCPIWVGGSIGNINSKGLESINFSNFSHMQPCVLQFLYWEINAIGFQLSEVRPAPHMDNLVTIYKNMEAASGLNIFVTQAAPSTKLPGGQNQAGADMVCGREKAGRNCSETPKPQSQKRLKGIGPKGSSSINLKSSRLNPVRPSFPTKKRVQLSQHPTPNTPTRLTKLEGETCTKAKSISPKSLIVLKDKPALNERGEPVLSPFFWLREDEEDAEKEDEENPSQQMYGDHLMDTPPGAPCFSDIKDSDDEAPQKMTPQGGTCRALHEVDFFDSEMFEWTQRACSPELCSSPLKMQAYLLITSDNVAKAVECETIEEKEGKSASQDTATMKMEGTSPTSSSARTENAINEDRTRKTNMRRRNARASTQKKRAKRATKDVHGNHIVLQNVAKENLPEEKKDDKESSLKFMKSCKKNTKVDATTNSTKTVQEDVSTSSDAAKHRNHGAKTRVAHLPTLLDQGKDSGGSLNLEKTGKDSKKVIVQQHLDSTSSSITRNAANNGAKGHAGVLISQSLDESVPVGVDKEVSDYRVRVRESEVKSLQDPRFDKEQKYSKKVKFSPNDDSKAGLVVDIFERVIPKKAQPLRKIHGNCDVGIVDDTSKMEKARPMKNGILRKCKTLSNKIQCGFCQSAEDSEVSGIMFHYLKGKPVMADHNGELHVDNFVMLCPNHASSKLPNEISGSQLNQQKKCLKKRQYHTKPQVVTKHGISTSNRWNSNGSSARLVLCCSALAGAEKLLLEPQETVTEFKRLSGTTVLKNWDSAVTHVIAAVDENGACRRTLKVLMGILEGKWILNIEWVKGCLKAMEIVDEKDYEIDVDIHGIRDGPWRGRSRLLKKQPKLFNGYQFYLTGDYAPSYKGYLQDLIVAAGGTLLHRKPISRYHEALSSNCTSSPTLIIYSLELPDKCTPSKRGSIISSRRLDAKSLASSIGAAVATNSWILDSIAACRCTEGYVIMEQMWRRQNDSPSRAESSYSSAVGERGRQGYTRYEEKQQNGREKSLTNQQKNWCRSAGEKLLRWSSRAARRRETAVMSAGAAAGVTGF